MRKYKIAINTVFAVLLIFNFMFSVASAQYWFQTGVRGSNNASFNSGASVLIQTIKPQNVSYGSFGYWTGENLANGAFIQIGYIINNQSGYYPTNCTVSFGCTSNVYIQKGQPSWFWEYFPANYNGNKFYGRLGGNDTVGSNGSFNDYSFIASGNTWNLYVNKVPVGSVDLGTSSSGANPPTAFSEYANGENNSVFMPTVKFRNLMFYKSGKFYLVPEGYSYVGYGKGSETSLNNNYGVNEVDNFVDYFEIGSGVAGAPDLTALWQIGYSLNVASAYGNISRYSNYSAYTTTEITAPEYVNISNGVRERFTGWKGLGGGSYTGSSESAYIHMDSNITETADWIRQYYVNVTTPYGNATGSGWYDANSTAYLDLESNSIYVGYGSRERFINWSNGLTGQKPIMVINNPANITANWVLQYYVNVTTPYGNATGSGWYADGAIARISLDKYYIQENSTFRKAFSAWSNGNSNSTLNLSVNKSVDLEAEFVLQRSVKIQWDNAYGNPVAVGYYYINGYKHSGSNAYLNVNGSNHVSGAMYRNVYLHYGKNVDVTLSTTSIDIKLPIFNATVLTRSFFGTPVNANLYVSFDNGTTYNTMSGSSGNFTLHNVPYGEVYGSATFFGIAQTINISGGQNAYLEFFTPSLIAAIVLGIIVIFMAGILGKIHYSRKK